jgi:hypothetical protein
MFITLIIIILYIIYNAIINYFNTRITLIIISILATINAINDEIIIIIINLYRA